MTNNQQYEEVLALVERVSGSVESEQEGLNKIVLLDEKITETPEGLNWATLQVAKANILNQTPGKKVGQYIDQAIHCYQEALRYRNKEKTPEDWQRTMSNLGIAWRRRLQGDKNDNLEKALLCYQQIDEAFPDRNTDTSWASTQANLGNLWFDRVIGDKKENIEKAIDHFTKALSVFTKDDTPALWARCNSNLSIIYQDRIKGNREENLEKAIQYNLESLTIYEDQAKNTEWARIQNNLGANYRNRLAGNPSDNYENSIMHYQNALLIWTREDFADDWARTQLNLGIVYRYRLQGNKSTNLYTACEYIESCLTIRDPIHFPSDWMRAQHSLSLVKAELRDWASLLVIADLVMEHVSKLIDQTKSLYEQRRLVGLASAIKNLGVLAHSYQSSPSIAYQYLIKNRGLIAKTLYRSQKGANLSSVTHNRSNSQKIDITFCVIPMDDEPIPVFITHHDGVKKAVKLIRLTGLDRKKLESLFEIKHGSERSWLQSYANLDKENGVVKFKTEMDRVNKTLSLYLKPLWAEIAQFSHKTTQLNIATSGLFSLVPFTALQDQNKEYLIAHFNIIQSLPFQPNNKTEQVSDPSVSNLLIIADSNNDLPNSRKETVLLKKLLPSSVSLVGKEAKKQTVLTAMENGEVFSHLHFACHGKYSWRHPEKSELSLANNETLTFDEIIQHANFSHGSIVVLSACESGVTEYRELPDEGYGLPLAFIMSGASTVISTLWPVPDQSSMFLMLYFYQRLLTGKPPSTALKEAQHWLQSVTRKQLQDYLDSDLSNDINEKEILRSLRWSNQEKESKNNKHCPYTHPFYWAGFIVNEAYN